MRTDVDGAALAVFLFFFSLVTVMGFLAARWRRPKTLAALDEWGLGGRQFGTWITWFLVGGDFYTAYTVIAVPALVYSVGAKPDRKGDTNMLTNSKIVLWFTLMLSTTSIAMAATKHPVRHERTTVVQTPGQTGTSSPAGRSYAMQPGKAQRSAPEPTYDLFRDPAFIAPQGSR
jgi:hypothetical protein